MTENRERIEKRKTDKGEKRNVEREREWRVFSRHIRKLRSDPDSQSYPM